MASRAGSPNKNKAFLLKRLQNMYGDDFNPVLKMAENAVTIQKIADDHAKDLNQGGKGTTVGDSKCINALSTAEAASAAWDRIAQYVEPKLKAVEVSGTGDGGAIDHKWRVEFVNATPES